MIHFKPLIHVSLGILLGATLTCCHNYYMVGKAPLEKARVIDSLKQSRFFVLRNGTTAYYMSNMVLSEDQKTLNCILDTLPPDHKLHLVKGRKGKMRYKKTDIYEKSVLNEVHFYINPNDSTSIGNYTLQLDQVQKIEVIERDKRRTADSYIIGAFGYTIGALAVVAIIAAATKSSCPFVSAYTGHEFVTQGEIYGGAIYPQLARDDYMGLQMQPTENGTLQLKISNELQERQYTDFADLIVVTHDKNIQVLCDEKGVLYQVVQPQAPIAAWSGNEKNAIAPLLQKNDNSLLHFDDTLAANANNFVVTEFNRPASVQKAKLVLSLKNSYWLDYLYGEMAKGFGNYYGTFIKKQSKVPASTLVQWAKDQQIPLTVSIEKSGDWQEVAEIGTIGPLAMREVVVPLDLSHFTSNTVKIKLSSGFMFWEIDYAAIDFSPDKNFEVETLPPSVATDETGKNVLPLLIKKDGKYLEQPVPGNSVTIEYRHKPQKENKMESYFLHTRGYYTHVRDFKGSPNVGFLNQFKQPGGFPLFSVSLYKKFRSSSMESLARN